MATDTLAVPSPAESEDKNHDVKVERSSVSTPDQDKVSVLDFAGDTTLPPPPALTPEQEKALYRKVDLKLMPILALLYLCSFLDRGKFTEVLSFDSAGLYSSLGNIGNAKLQGLTSQLNLVGNQYNIALVCYLFATLSWCSEQDTF